MNLIKNNSTRANAVRIIFYLMMAVDIISAYSNIMQYRLLSSAANGIMISPEEASTNDTRQQAIALIQLALIIGTVISFIMWYHRAYKNLHQLNIPALTFTPNSAAWAWFIPFLNLVRPYTIMREIWENTQSYVFQKGSGERISSGMIIGWWWAFWIINNLLGNVSGRFAVGADTIDQMILSTNANIASDVVDMIAMILTLIMITKMMDYEKKLWEFENDPFNFKKNENSESMNIPRV